mmetsp:Transcript_18331/g.50285  ORF Transcript_18331/g.50285 Transcript_18331/m.50285 type:complete len:407 (-) Transcript_18331:188-1408(-)
MARLKLHSNWEDCKRRALPEKHFLADLVRAARLDDAAIDACDLHALLESVTSTGGSSASTPPARLSSMPVQGSSAEEGRRGAPRPQSAISQAQGRMRWTPATSATRPESAPVPYSARPLRTAAVMSATPRTATSLAATPRAASPQASTAASPRGAALCCMGDLDQTCSPSVARIPKPHPQTRKDIPDVPEWFRAKGVPATVHGPFLPEFDLWVTLHGGNGTWKKQQATIEWEKQVREHRVFKQEWALREERERARLLEAERRRKQEAEEEERRAAEAEAERRRRREEDERRRQAEEQRRREKLEEEERERRRRLPRTCKTCEGTGRCCGCSGRGHTDTLYLAPHIEDGTSGLRTANAACGRLPRGCEMCGGFGDGANWGEYVQGSGRCSPCDGSGKIKAPKGGWPG